MKNLKAFLSVLVFLVFALSFMSFKAPDTDTFFRGQNYILLYAIVGVSVILILVFVFFALQSISQNKKNIEPPSSFSNTDDS